jgi:hypothetical protein
MTVAEKRVHGVAVRGTDEYARRRRNPTLSWPQWCWFLAAVVLADPHGYAGAFQTLPDCLGHQIAFGLRSARSRRNGEVTHLTEAGALRPQADLPGYWRRR